MSTTKATLMLALAALACGGTRAQPEEPLQNAPIASVPVTQADARPAQAATKASDAPPSLSPPIEREVLPTPKPRDTRALPRELRALGQGAPPPRHCGMLPVHIATRRAPGCGQEGQALEELARAVEIEHASQRDSALAKLEACDEFPTGLVRTLRADSMRQCADMLIEPYLRAVTRNVDAELGDTMLALALLARLERALKQPKPFRGERTEAEVTRYHVEVLLPWKRQELAKLAEFEKASVPSNGYASAVAVLGLERALRRVLWAARGAPIPEQLKKSYEARTGYYGKLDAALTDVRQWVEETEGMASTAISIHGIHRSPDADARYHPHHPIAHYSNRDDGYFGLLLLEPPAPLVPTTSAERIASRVPSLYSELLFGDTAASDERMLRALVESGLSQRLRHVLSRRKLTETETELLAYFRATLAQRTRDALHWDEAVALLEALPNRSPSAELVLATARAARTGPRDHRESKLQPRRGFDTAPLEQFSASTVSARLRAFALNNAARLNVLSQTPSSLEAASTLMRNSRAAAPDEPTRGCLLQSEPFGLKYVNEPGKACDLPTLP